MQARVDTRHFALRAWVCNARLEGREGGRYRKASREEGDQGRKEEREAIRKREER